MPGLSLRYRSLLGLLGATAALVAAPGASAASSEPVVSANWGGYAVTPASSSVKRFSSVRASWVAPAAKCTPGTAAFSAFWVGLGGFDRSSQALEQAGTEADCSSDGQPIYYAWYELVPAAPGKLKVTIRPGDTVSTVVHVVGHSVSLRVVDLTTGASATKSERMSAPDTSSAEWIAEAPSECDDFGNCRPLALADFGSVTFGSASASANGVASPISDPRWSLTALALSDTGSGFGRHRFANFSAATEAVPSALDATGGSFSVNWQQQAASQAPAPSGGYPGAGYGPGGSPTGN